jgi:S1-C subfamily serine protease
MIGGAAVLVVALVAAAMVMVADGTAAQQVADTTPATVLVGVPTTDPGVEQMANSTTIDSMLASLRPSMVALRVVGATGTTTVTALVAESGGIIVTSAQALVGARSVTAIEPDGSRQTPVAVGVDPTSGLAVLRIADDLPAADFDTADPAIGATAVAAVLVPGSRAGASPLTEIYGGTVTSAGQALASDAATTTFSATGVQVPLSDADRGCALVDRVGRVSGMLESVRGSGQSTMAVFLPAELVEGVTQQLVTSGAVQPGWLGVDTSNAAPTTISAQGAVVPTIPTADGALLDAVESGSPAAQAGLETGDVITAVDGDRVNSSAELHARIYPDPPGTTVMVTFARGGSTLTTSVVLGTPDPDAPGDPTSP